MVVTVDLNEEISGVMIIIFLTDPSGLNYGAEIRVETSEQFSNFEVSNMLPGDTGLRALEQPIRGPFYTVLTASSSSNKVIT